METKQFAAYERMKSFDHLHEIAGPRHNSTIVAFFADVGHGWVKDDETAWCAAAMGSMLKHAGLPHTGKLNARSYLDWGSPVELKDARPSDVVVFAGDTPAAGHVAFYERHDGQFVWCWGGNQSDEIRLSKYRRARLLSVRRWPEEKKQTRSSASAINLLINWLLSLFGRK